jgi:antibiotic biosynthesis monooxygenase (ABM) superfamily enzyme
MRTALAALALLALVPSLKAQQPSTVLHIINIKWKVEATPEAVKAAVDAAQQLPAKYPGIRRVWTRNLRYQGQDRFNQAIVLEFDNQESLRRYEGSAAQKWWYEVYLPVREDSRTHDVTN